MFKKNPLIVIFFTIFIDLLGFGILIPVIPLLLADPNSAYYLLPSKVSLKTGYLLLGLLTATFPLMQFLSAPILGQLSDKFGRRKILFFSIFGTFLSYLLFALGIFLKNIPLLFFSRAVDGITGGNISVAQAAIADLSNSKNRAKNFGLIGTAFGLGFILGPFIGGKLSDPATFPLFNAVTPFLFTSFLCFLNLISIYLFFPETNLLKSEEPLVLNRSIQNINNAINDKSLRIIFLTNFLLASGFTFFTTFLGVFLINRFRFNQGKIGDFFAYIGIWSIITQGFFVRKISPKFSEEKILKITLFCLALVMFSYYLPTSWTTLIFIVPLFAIFNGFSSVSLLGLLSKNTAPGKQGSVLGINTSVIALAQTLPPLLAGIIASYLSPDAPILIASFIVGLSSLVFLSKYRLSALNH